MGDLEGVNILSGNSWAYDRFSEMRHHSIDSSHHFRMFTTISLCWSQPPNSHEDPVKRVETNFRTGLNSFHHPPPFPHVSNHLSLRSTQVHRSHRCVRNRLSGLHPCLAGPYESMAGQPHRGDSPQLRIDLSLSLAF